MSVKVKLVNVRLAFPRLFEPKEYTEGDGKPRYDANFLIVKGSDNDKAIRAAISEAATESWGAKAQAQLKAIAGNSNKFCYADGDLTDREENAGHMVLSSHRRAADGAPAIVDRMKNKLTVNDGKPYAGCYVNGSIDIWAQKGTHTGMRCSLVGVQFSADGDAFAGSVASDAAFDDLGDDSGDVNGAGEFDSAEDSADANDVNGGVDDDDSVHFSDTQFY